jgi:hypothetical protein
MSPVREALYRLLLRAYPAAYRRARGEEMIGTLMEAARPGQRHPSLREAGSLVLRGLQTRAGVHSPHQRRQTLAGATRLAVLLLLASTAAVSLAEFGPIIGSPATPFTALRPLETLFAAAALVAVAAGRHVLGLIGTAATFVVGLLLHGYHFNNDGFIGGFEYLVQPWMIDWGPMFAVITVSWTFWPAPIAALLILPLIQWRPRGGTAPYLWLLAVPVAVVALPTAFDVTTGIQPGGAVATAAALLLWAAVDPRVTLAGGVLLLPLVIGPLAKYVTPDWSPVEVHSDGWFLTYAAAIVVLAATGAVRLRQQARI